MRISKALFLDRDGVINIDHGYIVKREDFEFKDGIFDLIKTARKFDYLPIIVTNQSGIARGYYSQEEFFELTNWMNSVFEQNQAPIEQVYHCPYHRDAKVPRFQHSDHPWRKPSPGMLLAARDDHHLDLRASILIGDRWSDIEAGQNANLHKTFLLGTPAEKPPKAIEPSYKISTLKQAQDWIERNSAN